MNKMNFNITEEEIAWIFKCIDENHSGNIDIHELMKFINLWLHNKYQNAY